MGSNPTGGVDVCLLCVLSGRGLCDGLITRTEESYRLWCVVECNLETLRMRRPLPTGKGGGCSAKLKKKYVTGSSILFRIHPQILLSFYALVRTCFYVSGKRGYVVVGCCGVYVRLAVGGTNDCLNCVFLGLLRAE